MKARYDAVKNRINLEIGDSNRYRVCRSIDARWSRSEKVWWGPANPQFANELVRKGWDVDDSIRSIGQKHDESMQRAAAIKQSDDLPQPPIRKHDLWRHQVKAYHFAYHQEACMLAMEMGTGKSAVAIALAENWKCKRVLVVCPKAVIPVWRREFRKHCSSDYQILPCETGNAMQKRTQAEDFMDEEYGGMKVVVVNYDTVRIPSMGRFVADVEWDLVIADESHRAKSSRSYTTRTMGKLHDIAKRRLALTGTPMPHSPGDLWGQFYFIDRTVFGSDYRAFRERYAIVDQIYHNKILAWINQDEMKSKFHERSFRCESKDVLDLPEIVHTPVTVELEPEARTMYRAMNNTMVVAVKSNYITAANAAVKMVRLQQMTSGFTIMNDALIRIVGTEKRDALSELFDTIPQDEKVVVFCQFTRDLDTVRRVAEEYGREFGQISGERKDLDDEGKMPEHINVMAVQYQAGAVGIDLTRARFVVMFSQTWNMGLYEQALARVHRPGQNRTTHVYHLICRGTIDAAIMNAIMEKKSVVDEVLENIEHIEEVADDF